MAIESFSDFHIDDIEAEEQNNNNVSLESELYAALAQQAQTRGVSIETLTNLWLQQKLDEYLVNQ